MLAGSSVVSAIGVTPRAVAARRRWTRVRRVLLHLSPVAWAYVDLVLIAAATWLAYRLMLSGNPEYRWVAGPWISGGLFCLSITIAGLIFGLYERHTLGARSRILVRSLASLSVGLVLAYAVLGVLFYLDTTRWLGLIVGLTARQPFSSASSCSTMAS